MNAIEPSLESLLILHAEAALVLPTRLVHDLIEADR